MAKRDTNGRLLPGQGALNPGGRPIGSTRELAELCRKHGPDAVKTLIQVMQTGDPGDQIAACKVLLDRGYGKAVDKLEISGPEQGPIDVRELSTQALEQIVARGMTSITLPK